MLNLLSHLDKHNIGQVWRSMLNMFVGFTIWIIVMESRTDRFAQALGIHNARLWKCSMQ